MHDVPNPSQCPVPYKPTVSDPSPKATQMLLPEVEYLIV